MNQPAVFFFDEHRPDEAALQRHMQTPHLKTSAAAVEDWQLEPFSVVVARTTSGPAGQG